MISFSIFRVQNCSSVSATMGSLSRFLSSFTIVRYVSHRFASTPFSSFFSSFSASSVLESVAYLRSMCRPPSTTPSRGLPRNSCSFMGTVHSRVQCSGQSGCVLRAFVFLMVKSDHRLPNSSCFPVCLCMEGKLAEISLKHLKPDDFIYVHGTLGSYQKRDASGEPQIFYKVYVRDLNYVRWLAGHPRTPRPGNLVEEMADESGPIDENLQLDRMILWQLFFACPSEWWDNRLSKRNPRLPDFRHKDTKKGLWLTPDDPPWIRRHLEELDASLGCCRSKRDADVLFTGNCNFEDF